MHSENGDLLPCLSYGEFITRGMRFLLEDQQHRFKGDQVTDEAGHPLPPYFRYAKLRPNGCPYTEPVVDRGQVYPAFHHALAIEMLISYYVYSGNPAAISRARRLADWNIAHSTPDDWLYGGLPYSTFTNGVPGGFVDGDAVMTDKPAITALAYLRLYETVGESKYPAAAKRVADTLAKNQSPEGTWPFRVNPKNGEVREPYTSSVIYAVMLFERLDALDGDDRYSENRDAALRRLFGELRENDGLVRFLRGCGKRTG